MGKTHPYHHGNLRVALLDAAEQELIEKGIEAFSLRGVAKRTGVSHNALGHHFGDAKGFLTAVATIGFKRLLQTQIDRQNICNDSSLDQFIALGLGYVDFATTNPAMFRLMFSSDKPNRADPALSAAMSAALQTLSQQTHIVASREMPNANIDLKDVMAAWAMVHGLADLLNSGMLNVLLDGTGADRDDVLKDVLMRLTYDAKHREENKEMGR